MAENDAEQLPSRPGNPKGHEFRPHVRALQTVNKQFKSSGVSPQVVPQQTREGIASSIFNPGMLDQKLAQDEERFDLIQQKIEAQEKAETDELTGLMKRNVFMERLDAEASRVNREYQEKRKEGAVDYENLNQVVIGGKLDIDLYGLFNDKFGHQTGDDVLRQLAQKLKGSSRKSDMFARIGGEEIGFADPFLVSEISQANNYIRSGERIRRLVEEMKIHSDTRLGYRDDLSITVSVGTTHYIPGESVEDTMKRADLGERVAKALGRNRSIHVTQANGNNNMLYIEDTTADKNIKDTSFPNNIYTYYSEHGWRELLVDEYAKKSYEFAKPPGENTKQKLYEVVNISSDGDTLKDQETSILYFRKPERDETGNVTTTMQQIAA